MSELRCGIDNRGRVLRQMIEILNKDVERVPSYTLSALLSALGLTLSMALILTWFAGVQTYYRRNRTTGASLMRMRYQALIRGLIIAFLISVVFHQLAKARHSRERTTILSLTIPVVVVLHMLCEIWVFLHQRERKVQSAISSEEYKVRDVDIRTFKTDTERFERMLLARNILHPHMDALNNDLVVGWCRGQIVFLRGIDVWFHNLRAETKRLLVVFNEWSIDEPPHVVWFIGVTEIDRHRYLVSSFCKRPSTKYVRLTWGGGKVGNLQNVLLPVHCLTQ